MEQEKNTFRKNVPEEKRKSLEASLKFWLEKYQDAAESLAESDEVHNADAVATKVSEERRTTRQFQLLA